MNLAMIISDKIRIGILLGAPLTEQNYERTGIPYLEEHFYVMVYDCTPWLGRDFVPADNNVKRKCSLVSIGPS